MKALFSAVIVSATLMMTGCVKEPEGPAERIGRSIDEMSKGIRDLGNDWDKDSQRDIDSRDQNSRDRYDSSRSSDYSRDRDSSQDRNLGDGYSRNRDIPDHDPYYDTPPSDQAKDDWDREHAARVRAKRDNSKRNDYRY